MTTIDLGGLKVKNKLVVGIHQPDFIPYIGYFYKIAKSNIFVFLDDAQFSNDNMHHWNSIKTPQGQFNLKVPVKHHFGDLINEVNFRNEMNWQKKHLKTISINYERAKHFDTIFPKFQKLINANYENLALMNISINQFICNEFGFDTEFVLSSDLNIHSFKEDRVIDICTKLNAETYLSGHGAKSYQKESNFNKKNIHLEYTKYHSFKYKQQWNEFIPDLSILDYIFNHGFDWGLIESNNLED